MPPARSAAAVCPADPPLDGPRALHLPHDPLPQPRPRARLARGDGGGARLVRAPLAQPAGHRRPLRLVRHPHLLALWALYRRRTLRMPAWEAAQLIAGPARAAPPRVARRGHPAGARAGRHADDLRARGARCSGSSIRSRACARSCVLAGRLDPRLHRAALLAAAASVVSARRADALQRVPAPAGPGAAGLRRRRDRRWRRLAREPGFVADRDPEARLPRPGAARACWDGWRSAIFWGDLRRDRAGAGGARGPREHIRRRQGVRVALSGRPRGARARRASPCSRRADSRGSRTPRSAAGAAAARRAACA